MKEISIKIWLPVIIVILIIFGLTVFYNWPKEEESPEIVVPPKEIPEIEIPADWKTYRNEEYGFEIKYPEDWIMLETNNGLVNNVGDGKVVLFNDPKDEERFGIGPGVNLFISHWESISDEIEGKANNINAKSIPDYLNKVKYGVVEKIGETTISGYKAYEIIRRGLGQAYAIWIDRDGHVYELFFEQAWDKEDLTQTEKQVISTFKFF